MYKKTEKYDNYIFKNFVDQRTKNQIMKQAALIAAKFLTMKLHIHLSLIVITLIRYITNYKWYIYH